MSDIESLLGFYESPINFDLSPHNARALTVGVVNAPIGEQQNLRHNPHIIYHEDVKFVIPDSSFAVTFMPAVQTIQPIQERINFIGISPTIRNNALFVSISGQIQPFLIGAVWFPLSDYVARVGQGTVLYRIPTQENLVISCLAYPASSTGVYTDYARILYGYLPDELDKMVIE